MNWCAAERRFHYAEVGAALSAAFTRKECGGTLSVPFTTLSVVEVRGVAPLSKRSKT